MDQRYDEQGSAEYFEYFNIHSFYPAPFLCYVAQEISNEVERLLKKSFSLYWVDVSAAANALRASLEVLLDSLKIPRDQKNANGGTVRMPLHRRIDAWSRYLLTPLPYA